MIYTVKEVGYTSLRYDININKCTKVSVTIYLDMLYYVSLYSLVAPCWSNPCSNGGLCFSKNIYDHYCSCPKWSAGKYCELGELFSYMYLFINNTTQTELTKVIIFYRHHNYIRYIVL